MVRAVSGGRRREKRERQRGEEGKKEKIKEVTEPHPTFRSGKPLNASVKFVKSVGVVFFVRR